MTSLPIISYFLLLLSGAWSEEVATPSTLLPPRNFNHHSYDVKKYFKPPKKPEPTKQGPVLFPNDGPPPPRLPLVVTTRPLLESIADSDLNPNPPNNSVAEQSQINHVTFKPDFLPRFNQYQPLSYSVAPLPEPAYEGANFPDRIPYADVVNKVRSNGAADNRYNDYEERISLPPIYKALSDYAQSKVLKTKKKPLHYHYKINNDHEHGRIYDNNEVTDGRDNTEYNEGDNYAFSYTVKDQKTGDDFSHTQQSSGSATNGEYRVRLPDGRMQIVSYTADENGYKADVRYDNEDNNNQVETKRNDYEDDDYKLKENLNQFNEYDNKYNSNNDPTDIDYNSRIDVNNDYTHRNFNNKQVKDDYFHPYDSKEYYNDYFAEYPSNYETHRSKFTAFKPPSTPTPVYSTVRPTYEVINDLFTREPFEPKAISIDDRAVEINAPSTPGRGDARGGDGGHVVVIAPKLYTSVRSSTPLVETINTTPKPFIVTPASYLASTIASIKERIKASKPLLSNDFLQRINKYLSFT